MTKTAKLVWLNDARGGILRARINAPTLTQSELDDLGSLLRENGFVPVRGIWEAPDQDPLGAARSFISAAHKMGIFVAEEGEP